MDGLVDNFNGQGFRDEIQYTANPYNEEQSFRSGYSEP
ncbi:uncharacterized protein METZ01_LOCUS202839 [marine metagenome]|uniref:Uncharacterized protein n=1 Tax=marine metagenome TaxID=408172 RepID=A0A382EHM8_9ZZZZ